MKLQVTWREIWRELWIPLVMLASIIFPYDRLLSFLIITLATLSLVDKRKGG